MPVIRADLATPDAEIEICQSIYFLPDSLGRHSLRPQYPLDTPGLDTGTFPVPFRMRHGASAPPKPKKGCTIQRSVFNRVSRVVLFRFCGGVVFAGVSAGINHHSHLPNTGPGQIIHFQNFLCRLRLPLPKFDM